MSQTDTPVSSSVAGSAGSSIGNGPASKQPLIDLSKIDLSRRLVDRAGIEKINPHRHEMALLDGIVWYTPDFKLGLGVWHVKADEFWVRGHFPGKALLPGVLQVEAGAQLGSFMYNIRFPEPRIAAFTHIEECCFRNPVVPGDTLYLMCQELKCSARRFTSAIQGMVNGKSAFEATIRGMIIG